MKKGSEKIMEYDLKIYTDNIEPAASAQIYALIAQPPFYGAKVRIMPDVHFGKGCVVGFTSTMTTMAIPNVIGVDIGCGMLTAELGKLEMDEERLRAMDSYIKENVPSGSSVYREAQKGAEELVKKLHCYKELRDVKVLFASLGSLGGGNHFIGATRS
ncbi:MAG: RtcB family protein [Lachnospiraceae bacterium]|nr:RtcB family protein [Robinsoniella sp.]MDY3767421.1 RtcB family protein [Lachnospiraceae bacterium]